MSDQVEAEKIETGPDILLPIPHTEESHRIIIRRCKLKRKRLIPEGESETLNLIDAVRRLAPSGSPKGRANVLKLKPGQFVGVSSTDGTNFVIVNPTRDGDIRWLFERVDIGPRLQEVYLVEDVMIENHTVDLPLGPKGVAKLSEGETAQ
jgi:hypothetical protein